MQSLTSGLGTHFIGFWRVPRGMKYKDAPKIVPLITFFSIHNFKPLAKDGKSDVDLNLNFSKMRDFYF